MTDILEQRKNRSSLASAKQRQASNPDKSVWVEASAGTGKTKVLSDRVLRLLLKGVPPGKILCLTYTKAAAVEMNTRIAGRLSRWAVIEDIELDKELSALFGHDINQRKDAEDLKSTARRLFATLLDTPDGMKIQTIHSFCQEILKRFPLEAHISPYFDVMDDRAAAEALDKIKSKLLQKIEQEPDSRTAQALGYITSKVSEFTFPKIMNSLAGNRNKISRLLQNYISIDELLETTAKRLGIKTDDTPQKILSEYCSSIDREKHKRIMDALFQSADTDKKRAETLATFLSSDEPEKHYSDYRNIFLKQDGEIRKTLAAKKAVAVYPDIIEEAYHIAETLQTLDNKLSAVGLFQTTQAVLYLAEDLIGGYNHYKKIHSKMDYEDLIVVTRQLLENKNVADWVLYKLDGGIDNVLIDEAQDTSPDQWAIIRAITEDFFSGNNNKIRTIFAVGDRKQSIYSFQGADPREFEKMRHYFADKTRALNNFEEVRLDVSFRSTAAILDTVNSVFSSFPAKKGVILEGQDITHTPSRIGDGGIVELWPVTEAEEDENPDIWQPPVERKTAVSTSSRLAAQIASNIKKMVEGKDILASQNRPVQYSDFMILVQRRNSFVEELVRECKNCGVNIAGVDKIKLLEQIAVQDLVAVAKFLLLPEDDLTLACILKSPLFGLNDDDLFELCYNRGNTPLWLRLLENKEYRQTAETLKELLNMADTIRPFELYAHILNKLEGRKKFISRLGHEAADGIDEFVNLTLNFEQEHIPTLQNFVGWIEKDEVEIKRELEQSDINAVRIMTVHGSKGLQAPIVILPDTVRVKNIKNEAGLLWDDNVLYYPFSSENYEANCRRLKEQEKELSLEEYRRLLYVALTRAEERLYICGYAKSTKPSEESWYEICASSLKQIGEERPDGGSCYTVPQQITNDTKGKEESTSPELPDYAWVHTVPEEESPLAKPLTPSKLDENEEEETWASPITPNGTSRYRRGRIIHKLLQFLPETRNDNNKAEIIAGFLNKNAPDISEKEINRIQNEILRLLENKNFAAVFSENSRAEVPVMGQVDGRIISGQIDRLVIEENRIMIIDFKTNRPAAQTTAEIPSAYVKQLAAYKQLITAIYPDKNIETYILWTDTANLMEVIC